MENLKRMLKGIEFEINSRIQDVVNATDYDDLDREVMDLKNWVDTLNNTLIAIQGLNAARRTYQDNDSRRYAVRWDNEEHIKVKTVSIDFFTEYSGWTDEDIHQITLLDVTDTYCTDDMVTVERIQ